MRLGLWPCRLIGRLTRSAVSTKLIASKNGTATGYEVNNEYRDQQSDGGGTEFSLA